MSILLVQHVDALTPITGIPSLSVTTPVTRGNLLLLQVQTTSNEPIVPDDGRNIWVPIPTSPLGSGQAFLQVFWAVAESTRALTINVFGISSGGTGNYYQATPLSLANVVVQFMEWSGTSITGIYAAGQNSGTGTAPNNNVDPANIGDINIAFCVPASGSTANEGTSGYTNVSGAGTNFSAIYKATTVTGGQNIAFAMTPSGVWSVISFSFGTHVASNTIQGALGAAGKAATVTFISQTSGYTTSTTADVNGNYTASLETDTWIVQPQLVGATFSPSVAVVHNTATSTQNFTASVVPTPLVTNILFTDTMNRANESPLTGGGNWTFNGTPVPPFDSPFDIVSDEAVVHSTTPLKNYAGPFSGDAVSVYAGHLIPSDQYCEFQVDGLNPSPVAHATFALSFRSAANNVAGYFYAGVPNGDGTLTLGLWALGAPVLPVQPTNLLASPGLFNQRYGFWKTTVPFTAGDKFGVGTWGNTVYMFHNGTLIGTYKDLVTQGLFAGTLVLYGGSNAASDLKISNVKFGSCWPVGAAVTDVVNTGITSGGATSFALPAFPLLAGEGVVVFARWFRNTSQNIVSVTDTAGNTYLQAGSPLVVGTTSLASYYCANARANAANVVTMTFSANTTFVDVTAAHVPTLGALDTTGSGSAPVAATTVTGSITTANPNELVFAYSNADSANGSLGQTNLPTSMDAVYGATPILGGYSNFGYQGLATAQSKSFTATNASSLTSAILLVAFGYTPYVPPPAGFFVLNSNLTYPTLS